MLAELESCSEPTFLLGRGIEVGILHVPGEHLQAIQGCDGKRKSYAVPRHNTGEYRVLWRVSKVASCDKARLPLQRTLDIKYHVALDLSVGNRNLPVLTEFECYSDILHLLLNGISPEGGPRFIVNRQGLLDRKSVV